MTDPVKPNYIIYGGTKVDANQIAQKRKTENGVYIIDFKNGQRVEYRDQSKNGFAELDVEGQHLGLKNMHGACVYGAPDKKDYIYLGNSLDGYESNNQIFVNNDDKADQVMIFEPGTKNNIVHMGDEDRTIYTSEFSHTVYVSGPDDFNQETFKTSFPKLDTKW